MMLIKWLAATAVLFGQSWSLASPAKNQEVQKTQKPVFVKTQTMSEQDFFQELKYAANIRPFREVEVFSYIDGTVARKLVSNGQRVKKGQTLATIKNIQPGFNYSEHVVRAPIAGVVTQFFEEEGTLISKSKSLVTIADTKKLRISAAVLQEHLAILEQENLQVAILPVGHSEPITAKVSNISPNIDEVLGTTVVEFTLQSQKSSLRPGMLAKILVRYDRKSALGIDQKYLKKDHFQNRYYLFSVGPESKVQKQYVQTGLERNGLIEVTEGLQLGDVVVTQAADRLKDGQVITLQREDKKDSSSAEKASEKI